MGLILFKDCARDYKFRFDLKSEHPNVGDVFSIDGIYFNGFASVIEYAEIGDLFDSDKTLFIQQRDCPEIIEEVFISEVIDEVVEPEVIEEVFEPDVVEVFAPSPPYVTPEATIQSFCVSTQYGVLGSNVGNYSIANALDVNGYVYYTGETSGVIYFNMGRDQWCLSNSFGGDCILFGKTPCYTESYPDLYSGIVFSGACPTPTPSPASCEVIDFSAYFNCDLSPTATPTPTITPTITTTPTVTPTPSMTGNLSVNVGMSAYTYTYPSVTPSPTPTVTPTNNIIISGDVTYNVVDKTFAFSGTRVLTECSTGIEYYAYQSLIFSNVPVVIGESIRAVVNGEQRCFEYTSNSTAISSPNIYLDEILAVSADCSTCLITPTPTPTATITPSVTQTLTPTPTPTPSSGMVYVFQSCLPIGLNVNPSLVIQTQPYQSSLSVNSVIKDFDGNCWSYLGAFSNTYIPPTNVNPITYTGNYFASYTSSSFVDCQACLVSLNLS